MTYTVLIVEDDAQMMSMMAEMLTRAGHNVVKQPILGETLSSVDKNPKIDVVLLDIWHDGQPAFDTLDQIKAMHPALKTLVISGGGGYLSTEVSIAIADLGQADAILLKPFTRSSLLSQVSKLFG
jgi:DNA-binding NtrC family response regulator